MYSAKAVRSYPMNIFYANVRISEDMFVGQGPRFILLTMTEFLITQHLSWRPTHFYLYKHIVFTVKNSFFKPE